MLECVRFFPENESHIFHEYNLDFEGTFCHVQQLLLFSVPIIITNIVPEWLLSKNKLRDSKTKLESLFSSFRTRSLYFEYIH